MKKTEQFKITGMTCASCVMHIEKDLQEMDGVEEVVINFATEGGSVTYDEKKVKQEDIIKTVKKAGYHAEPLEKPKMEHGSHHGKKMDHTMHGEDHSGHAQAESRTHIQERLIKLTVSTVLSVIILGLTFVYKIPQGMEVMMILSLIILVYSGREFFQRGIPNLLKGRPGMDTLVALGVGAAFLYSSYNTLFAGVEEEYFMDVAIITTFILLGRYLEARAKGRASEAIKKLLQLSAKVAHRITESGRLEDVPADHVKVGDLLRVKPGEKIPVDGIITADSAAIDESMVTGESMPVDKQEGSHVIGATVNGNTAFSMRAEKVGKDTMLSHIAKLVHEAQMSKAPIQKLVDVVSAYFVWVVIGIAITTFLIWMLVMGAEPAKALIVTVAVLIIACPCALGLATPISIVVGSGKGAGLGILIKQMESLEKAHKITAIAFDKTGTITKGQPEVQEYKNFSNDEKTITEAAYVLETQSEHPLAKSIISFLEPKMGSDHPEVSEFESKPGKGVKGKVDGSTFYLGSTNYMEELGALDKDSKKEIKTMKNNGYTVLCMSDGNQILALFGVQDGVKESSKAAIELLKKRGIKTVMLTGDHEKVAQKIADEVGIDEVYSEVKPEDKKDIIEKLQKDGYFVAMVGDGINDSPALAKADVGIAMGTGTDIAMESGDLVLVHGDLMKAVEAIELSRATLRNIKQNLFWAFIYNSIGIPLAAFGLLTPAFSAGAMAFSSVSVVLNALRLKRFKVKY